MAAIASHIEDAPVAQAIEEKPWQAVLKHPKLLMYAVLVNIGPLLFGYDMVVIGAVSALPQFK